jgi:hypothetical protein
MSQPTTTRVERAANLFDLRRIIGAVMTVWGVLLIVLGLTDSTEEANKAAGININLYAGIGMLIVGIVHGLIVESLIRTPKSIGDRHGERLAPVPLGDGCMGQNPCTRRIFGVLPRCSPSGVAAASAGCASSWKGATRW